MAMVELSLPSANVVEKGFFCQNFLMGLFSGIHRLLIVPQTSMMQIAW